MTLAQNNNRDLTKPRRRRQRERQKTIRLMCKTTALQVYHAFLYICLHCTTTTWNDQILSLLGNGNGKAINSTISVRTWARSPLFSSSQNPLLLSNRANWDNQSLKWCEVCFSATSPLSDRKVPNIHVTTSLKLLNFDYSNENYWTLPSCCIVKLYRVVLPFFSPINGI